MRIGSVGKVPRLCVAPTSVRVPLLAVLIGAQSVISYINSCR